MNKSNISDYISFHAQSVPEKIVFEEISGRHISYQNFDDKVNQCCYYLNSVGIKQNDIISLCIDNNLTFLTLYFASIRSNVIVNPLPFSLSSSEIIKNLGLIKPKYIFHQNKDLKNQFLSISEADIKSTNIFFDVLEKFDKNKWVCKNSLDDISCIYHSSGTTGDPKCVEYSHNNMLNLIESIVEGFGYNEDTRFLGVLPLGHTAIINYQLLPSIFAGSSIVLAKNFSSIRPNFWDIVASAAINSVELVPTIVFSMLNTPYDLGVIKKNTTLKYVGCGSAPLSKEIQSTFKKKFCIPLSNLYGLSETGPSHFDNPIEENWQPGSIGFPLKVNKCKILKSNLEEAKDGETGQIAIKGKNVFVGYFNNDKAYKKAFHNGYFLTGDLGYKDKDGRYFFVDRVKDLIIRGGVNIVPGEIEELLYQIEGVNSVAVYGISDKLFGEKIVAVIEQRSNLNEKDIKTYLSRKLQPLKVPEIIHFVDSMPKTASGKIFKKELKEKLS